MTTALLLKGPSAPPTATTTARAAETPRVGTIELGIPKVITGAYFPSLLERRRRAEKGLHAVVAEAYVKGISTHRSTTSCRGIKPRTSVDGIDPNRDSLMRMVDAPRRAIRVKSEDRGARSPHLTGLGRLRL